MASGINNPVFAGRLWCFQCSGPDGEFKISGGAEVWTGWRQPTVLPLQLEVSQNVSRKGKCSCKHRSKFKNQQVMTKIYTVTENHKFLTLKCKSSIFKSISHKLWVPNGRATQSIIGDSHTDLPKTQLPVCQAILITVLKDLFIKSCTNPQIAFLKRTDIYRYATK